jgi:flavin-dependent thymidylate synthase
MRVDISYALCLEDIITLLTYCKYLNVFQLKDYSYENEDLLASIIISGSIRGYIHLFNMVYADSKLYDDSICLIIEEMLIAIIENTSWGKELFGSVDYAETFPISEFDVFSESDSLNTYSPEDIEKLNEELKEEGKKLFGVDDKYVEIISGDTTFSEISNNRYRNLPLDILNTSTVTVRFINASRTATHQLVRHRNGITQQSQRYVDSSHASFTTPNPDAYKGQLYSVEGFEGEFEFSQLCNLLFYNATNNYSNLVSQGVKKEDARAVLLNNTNCYELYMTTTLGNYKKFIELRTDPHAQDEIRKYALSLDKVLTPYIRSLGGDIYDA